jgi:hypothetical protein
VKYARTQGANESKSQEIKKLNQEDKKLSNHGGLCIVNESASQ